MNIPLSEKYRPQNISDILGQDHLLSSYSILHRMFESQKYHSFIMWGNPGTGKTTIAKLIQKQANLPFLAFSAVLSGIKEVKDVMKSAEQQKRLTNEPTIIFIDEIHRFNKSQQDAFLPFVESGAIILIGATTENPSFYVISALLSRCHVFILNQLSVDNIKAILKKIITAENADQYYTEGAIDYIANSSGADTRKAINLLEITLANHREQVLDVSNIGNILSTRTMLYDKKGEEHYNLISALHKSLRGSDPQAGLYWLARMLESGDDPLYIARRLIRFASEDVGLSDPNALVQANAAKEALLFLGMPEAKVHLAQAVIYLATAPKSNTVDVALMKATEKAIKTGHLPVPLHIRNAPTKLMKDLGYGADYQYDHEHENRYYYQKYFPDNMIEEEYYTPSEFGFEKEIEKRLKWWKSKRKRE
ncbi:MAG: replication-associated recombination protein A [Candidatus Cloacimonetes bacterium]|nr:replication-associated recombination protein A [Candidatus Cloacimonadota bacterium]